MKKVAVFGKPGSGKSTFSKALAKATNLPLHQLDSIHYNSNGQTVDRQVFDARHDEILSSDAWIIDGLGPLKSFNQRLEAADTLIYIDLPYSLSYWLVTKRLLKGLFITPEGWPPGSSIVKGTIQSYKTLQLCPGFWNEQFMQKLEHLSATRSLRVIRTLAELRKAAEKV